MRILICSIALFAVACGGGKKESEPAAAGAEAAAAKFDDKTDEEKKKYMQEVVAPQMAALFQGVNAERYANMDCTTCHGPGAKEGKFDMPTDALPKLNPANSFEAHMGDDKKAVTMFMMEQVVPKMADLLGEEKYNPETQKGFGCFGCHMMAQ